jgi:AcrR family transcriptional regulator
MPAPARAGRPRKHDLPPGAQLSAPRILQAALARIDALGLAAFTIRDLARDLGVVPAAIYWHVPSRDALVSGAIALALADIACDLPAQAWPLRLRELLRRFRAALRRHPNLAPAVAQEMAYNGHFDPALLDEVLAALDEARFEGAALVQAYNVVIAALCGFATLELSRVPAGAPEAWEAVCRAQIDAVDPRRHPHLAHHRTALRNRAFLLRWSSGQQRPLDDAFEAWVDVVIGGLEQRSAARPGPD